MFQFRIFIQMPLFSFFMSMVIQHVYVSHGLTFVDSKLKRTRVIIMRRDNMCHSNVSSQSRLRPNPNPTPTPTSLLLSTEKYNDNEYEGSSSDKDWMNAELTLLNSPTQPDSALDPLEVANICCRSLQLVDKPTPNAGLERCFPFFMWECRKAVTARKGGDTVERFCKFGVLSPALQPFMGADHIDIGDMTIIPAQPPIRGAIATLPIQIRASSLFSVAHMSGMGRNGVAEPQVIDMVMRLEQQRRPPNQGCWLVREIIDVRMAFAGDSGNAGVAS